MESNESVQRPEYENVYRDTLYFIDAIVKDYDFYDGITSMIRDGSTEIEIKKRLLKKSVDETWVTAVEAALPALDSAVRNPGRFLKETDKVLPIELAHNITNRSLRHLAQHSDYISKVEGDNITPSKILNIYRDETTLTYENKFVNTLIHQLYEFIDRRWSRMCRDSANENTTKLEITSSFDTGRTKGKFTFGIEVGENAEISPESETSAERSVVAESLNARIEKLHSVSLMYMNSEFAKSMGNSMVRPPIVRTNAITKNKYLRECLALWEFISSYNKIGYKIDIEETAEAPDEVYIKELYSMLALQYVVFQYNIGNSLDGAVLAKNASDEPIEPKFITTFEPYNDDDFNVFETEYRKSYYARRNPRVKTALFDEQVNDAIDIALEADKLIRKRREDEARRRRLLAEQEARRLRALEEARQRVLDRAARMKAAEEARKQKRKTKIIANKQKAKTNKEKQRGDDEK